MVIRIVVAAVYDRRTGGMKNSLCTSNAPLGSTPVSGVGESVSLSGL
jgi:hypothetical protein